MKYVEGNLLDLAEQGHFDKVVQGCNCYNVMGGGIAKQIKDRYEKAYLVDKMTEEGDRGKLGKFTQAHISGFRVEHGIPETNTEGSIRKIDYNFTIINAYTQFGFGGGNDLDYKAVYDVFKQIKLLYDNDPKASCRIGIPKIGAGLGGGDWDKIERIIDSVGFSDLTCVVFV